MPNELLSQAPEYLAWEPEEAKQPWYRLQTKRWASLRGRGFNFSEPNDVPQSSIGLQMTRGNFVALIMFDRRGLSFRGIHTRFLEFFEGIAEGVAP